MWDLIPGVIVAVPLPQCRVPAVRGVMASQGVPSVVGYRIQVIHRMLCMETKPKHQSTLETFSQRPPSARQILTAVVCRKLSQVQFFQRKVDECGEFAGAGIGVWEALQVWEGKGVKEHVCGPMKVQKFKIYRVKQNYRNMSRTFDGWPLTPLKTYSDKNQGLVLLTRSWQRGGEGTWVWSTPTVLPTTQNI